MNTALALIAGATIGNLIFHGLIKKSWAKAWAISGINAVLLLAFIGLASLAGVNFK